jgi:hypothetical protein
MLLREGTIAVQRITANGKSARVARAIGFAPALGVVLIAGILTCVSAAAHAETFVLVYSEGSVVALPGGVTVAKGEQIDSQKLVQLGPADLAIFVSESGNVVTHDGPYCGTVASAAAEGGSSGLFASLYRWLGEKPAAPVAQGCSK